MREGESVLGLTPVDEKGAEILRTSGMLAGHGAVGRRFCGSISFKRGKCPCCGCVFEAACTAVIRGSATCREDRHEIVGYCVRVPDGEMAKQMRARTSFPLKAGAVRNARGAARNAVMQHNARVPGRIGRENFHSNDESTIKGKGGRGGGRGGGRVMTILERAARAASPKSLYVLGACTKQLVYLRLRDSRSKATLGEAYIEFIDVPAAADNYAGQPCKNHQNDMIHRIRGAEFFAVRAADGLARAGRMGADDVFVMMRQEWEWARLNMARIMGAPGSYAVARFTDRGSPVREPAAPSARPLPDGSGRRRDAGEVRAAGDGIDDDGKAAARRGELKAYFRMLFLYLFLRCWDTASEQAAQELRNLVTVDILPLYGDRHPVRTAISNALSTLFFALSVPGMPFDSNDIERVFHSLLGPFKRAHVQVQSVWGMTVAEELLTFIGMWERNGIDPARGLDRLICGPDWFAADDGAAEAVEETARHPCAPTAVRRVRRYRPTGPGPPP